MPTPILERFGSYEISQNSDGDPIELFGADDEAICLAADPNAPGLLELHLPRDPHRLAPSTVASFHERGRLACELRGEAALTSALSVWESGGLLAYTTPINEGEPIEQYVGRLGPISLVTTLGLVVELLARLVELPKFARLFRGARLTNAFVCHAEDGTIRLRVVDYGLSRPEPPATPHDELQPLIPEIANLIVLMLTGRKGAVSTLAEAIETGGTLPSTVKLFLNVSSPTGYAARLSVQQLLSGLRADLSSISKSYSSRNRREHLHIARHAIPHSAIETALTPEPVLPDPLSTRFTPDRRQLDSGSNFAIPATDSRFGGTVRLQILPPYRVISPTRQGIAPGQFSSLDPELNCRILRVLEAWEGGEANYVSEEAWPGFPLSFLLSRAGRLTPIDTLIVLRQVARSIAQVIDADLEVRDLRVSNLVVCFPRATNQSDLRQYLEKRIECWPSFVIKLRVHQSMRGLTESPTSIESILVDESTEAAELVKQRFVALAIHLLTAGTGEVPSEALMGGLKQLFVDCAEAMRNGRPLPTVDELLDRFAAAIPDAPAEPSPAACAWADYSRSLSSVLAPDDDADEASTVEDSSANEFELSPAAVYDDESDEHPRPRRARVAPQPAAALYPSATVALAPKKQAEIEFRHDPRSGRVSKREEPSIAIENSNESLARPLGVAIGQSPEPAPFDPAPIDDFTDPEFDVARLWQNDSSIASIIEGSPTRFRKLCLLTVQIAALVLVPALVFGGIWKFHAAKPSPPPPLHQFVPDSSEEAKLEAPTETRQISVETRT